LQPVALRMWVHNPGWVPWAFGPVDMKPGL